MHLNVFVSQNCFTYCRGCYSFSREEEKGAFVPTPKLVDFLKYAYNRGVSKITLCGGDPLTRPDIIELLKELKDIGFMISLDTLGTSIIKDVIVNEKEVINKIDLKKLISYVDIIGIPIDGSTNDIFKLFRCSKDDILNEQLAIGEKLGQNGAKVCINTVVHKGNLSDAKNLAILINKMDYVSKWQIFKFAPLGKYGSLNKNNFEITDKEFQEFQEIVLQDFNNKNIELEFKDNHIRDNTYLLIDNSGDAFIPSFEENNLKEKRTIIGNIYNHDDWDSICECLEKKEEI